MRHFVDSQSMGPVGPASIVSSAASTPFGRCIAFLPLLAVLSFDDRELRWRQSGQTDFGRFMATDTYQQQSWFNNFSFQRDGDICYRSASQG
jgi:hypothetical protein